MLPRQSASKGYEVEAYHQKVLRLPVRLRSLWYRVVVGCYVSFGGALWWGTTTTAPEPTHWRWQPGQEYSGLFDLAGHQLPLPHGAWTLVGIGTDPVKLPSRQPYGVIFTLVLFQLGGSVVKAFAVIHTNAIPTGDNWGLSADCLRTDLPFVKVYDNTERHASCAFIRPLVVAPHQTLPAWQKAVAFAHHEGWQLASSWLEAGFRVSDPYDFLDVRYAFQSKATTTTEVDPNTSAHQKGSAQSPEPALSTTTTLAGVWHGVNPWGKTNPPPPTAPDKPAVDNLSHWSEEALPLLALGFKRLLTNTNVQRMPDEPPPAEKSLAPPCTPENHTPEEMSNAKLGLLKTLSSRVTNITTSLGIDYLFIRDIYTVSGLQVVSSTLHGGVDYLEELMWNTYGPQRLRQSGTIDFTYLNSP